MGFFTQGETRIKVQFARIAAGIAVAMAIAFSPPAATAQDTAIPALLGTRPWEYGVFVNGGFGTANRADYKFLWAGVHGGKVLTNPMGKGLLRGQFELGVEFMPLWQAYTPKYQRANCYMQGPILSCSPLFPTGGTYTGLSITPAILRWNLKSSRRLQPWVQGAGGLIWTNHKFPPVGPYPVPNHLGTSVFNFTPQFGLGVHYFVKPRQSISISANAVHISNASIGDSNPGVNASVQFSIGYTWWK
ncbi:MAG: acyloxyacyl hydrolase [Acidobacteriaceae bacterium]